MSSMARKTCGQCRNCRHWEKLEVPISQMPNRADHGECKMTTCGETPEIEATIAVAVDYEAYGARLVTAPHFGCVQFEKKERPAQ